jgi:hypothetical protein
MPNGLQYGRGKINYKDPRFQRAQQRGMQNPLVNRIGLANELSAQWAGQQQRTLTDLYNLHTARTMFDRDMNLAERKFDFAKKKHAEKIGDAETARKWQIGLGLPMLGLSAWLGKKRADRISAHQAKVDAVYNRFISGMKGNEGLASPKTSIKRSQKPTNPILRRRFK